MLQINRFKQNKHCTNRGDINNDHLNTTEVVGLYQDDHSVDVHQLPPLATVSTTTAQEKRKGNTRTFKANNTTRKDSVEVKPTVYLCRMRKLKATFLCSVFSLIRSLMMFKSTAFKKQ